MLMRPATALLLLGLTQASTAEELVFFDFDYPDGTFDLMPTRTGESVAIASMGVTNGTLTDYAGNPGRAIGSNGFDTDNGFVLNLSPAQPGGSFIIDRLSFDQRASSSGPQLLTVLIEDTVVAELPTTTGFTTVDLAIDGFTMQHFHAVTIKGSGASSSAGTYRIDNLLLEGRATGSQAASPVPLPLPLYGVLPALGLLLRSRRESSDQPLSD